MTTERAHIIFDGAGCSLGRLASIAAKRILLGDKIDIINAEKVLVSSVNVDDYLYKTTFVGVRGQGPYFPKAPDQIVKWTVRGMLPWKNARGKEAYKRIRVYIGSPEGLSASAEALPAAKMGSKIRKHTTLGELSRRLGGKW